MPRPPARPEADPALEPGPDPAPGPDPGPEEPLPDDAVEGGHPPLPVLAQGDGWLVVAKPPRVIVHRNAQMRHVSAVLQRVRAMTGQRVYLAHRLDRGTSGCLLVAVGQGRAGELSRAITDEAAQKTYVAFVRGWFREEEPVRVESSILAPHGLKEAASVVELLGRSQDPRCSLLRVRPETGRHHQVRRHVRDLSHPIIGDTDHGDSKVNREWRALGADRLGLHCLRLQLRLEGGEEIDVTCPLYEDQARLWRTLPWWEEAVAREPALALPPLSMDWVGPIA